MLHEQLDELMGKPEAELTEDEKKILEFFAKFPRSHLPVDSGNQEVTVKNANDATPIATAPAASRPKSASAVSKGSTACMASTLA